MELSIAGDEWTLRKGFALGCVRRLFVKCFRSCCVYLSWEIGNGQQRYYVANQKPSLISKLKCDIEIVVIGHEDISDVLPDIVELGGFSHCELYCYIPLKFSSHVSGPVKIFKAISGKFFQLICFLKFEE